MEETRAPHTFAKYIDAVLYDGINSDVIKDCEASGPYILVTATDGARYRLEVTQLPSVELEEESDEQ